MHFCIFVKFESIYSKIPCFVEKIPKQVKSIVYPNKNLWFSTNKYLQLLLIFPKTLSKNLFYFPRLPPFEQSQVTSPWSKQQEFKIQTNKVPLINPYPTCLVHPKSCIHSTPLTLWCKFKLYVPKESRICIKFTYFDESISTSISHMVSNIIK